MNLIKFILRSCRGMMVITTLTALLSGACNAGLIALVNMVITGTQHGVAVMWGFIALGLGKVITYFASQGTLASFSQKAVADVRRDLIRKILAVPLRHVEELGAPRVLVA